MCPLPGKKSQKSDDTYIESAVVSVLALDYHIHLHYAVAHMRRTDGALPPHVGTGRKALNFLAGRGQFSGRKGISPCVAGGFTS